MNLRPLGISRPTGDRIAAPRVQDAAPAWNCELLELESRLAPVYHGAVGRWSWARAGAFAWAPRVRRQRKLSDRWASGLEWTTPALGEVFKLVRPGGAVMTSPVDRPPGFEQFDCGGGALLTWRPGAS